MKLYGYIIANGNYHGNKKGNDNISDGESRCNYCIISPETMIRVARLSLWSRILCKAPPVLKSLCSDMACAKLDGPLE